MKAWDCGNRPGRSTNCAACSAESLTARPRRRPFRLRKTPPGTAECRQTSLQPWPGTLALGIAEFVMMGILPDVARSLGVSIPEAGHLISAYAIGVCCGAPMLVAQFADAVVGQFMRVDNYVVFSVGRIRYGGETKTVSFGILGHVFTFDADDIGKAMKKQKPLPDTMAV